jgi:hypothetical protein
MSHHTSLSNRVWEQRRGERIHSLEANIQRLYRIIRDLEIQNAAQKERIKYLEATRNDGTLP